MPEVSIPAAAAPPTHPPGDVVDFARAFRAAARAVSFYPASHPSVTLTLQQLAQASTKVSAVRPLILTVLPATVLAGGLRIEGPELLAEEVADVLHRHGVGALTVTGRATLDSWRALLELLARRPDDVRATGGIQRHWQALRHGGPGLLEIDFGEMLRGRVGGDFAELAAVLNFYLQTEVIDEGVAEDLYAALVRVLEQAGSDEEAVTGVLRQVRAAASVTRATNPERLDDLFRRAATAAERMSPGVLAGLLASRGTPDACVGTVDVVAAMVERVADSTVTAFLRQALAGDLSPELSGVFVELVPQPERRLALLNASRAAVRMEDGTLEKWEAFALSLTSLSDRQFVSDQYERELASARERSTDGSLDEQDPPERVAAWVSSIAPERVRELDVQLLVDLAHVETDPDRWRDAVPILERQVLDVAAAGDWEAGYRILEALAEEGRRDRGPERREPVLAALKRIADAPVSQEAVAVVAGGGEGALERSRFLMSVGPGILPAVVRERLRAVHTASVERLDAIVAAYGKDGRETLRKMLTAPEPDLRIAVLKLLGQTKTTEHLPSLEGMLTDGHSGVRQEAVRALVGADSARGFDILLRGLAQADAAGQMALLDQVVALGTPRSVPPLRHLLAHLDQRTADPALYLAIIAALRRAGTPEAAAALGVVFEQAVWNVPLRALKFRSAAKAALEAIGGEPAREVLSRASIFRWRRPAGSQGGAADGTDKAVAS